MRRIRGRNFAIALVVALALAVASTSNVTTSYASSILGTKCTKVGVIRKVSGVSYRCTKSGKTLNWAKTIVPTKASTSSTPSTTIVKAGTNGEVGHSSWVVSISPNPVRPSQPITIISTITCGPIMSLTGSPRYPNMNAWINYEGFKTGNMGAPVLSSGGNTATFSLTATAPTTEGKFAFYSYARDFEAPNACFGDIKSYVNTKNYELVVRQTALSSTVTVPSGTKPKDGAACSAIGDSYVLSVGRLECRQFSDSSTKWVTLSSSPTAPAMPAGGSNLEACKLREARIAKYQPWNVGFPRGDANGTSMLPTSGRANVQLIAIEFPDAIGTATELTDADLDIAEFNKWFAFTSNNTLSFNWQYPKRWLRMPNPTSTYGPSIKGNREKFLRITTDMIAAADPYVDFTNSDFVFVLLPRSIKLGDPDIGWANNDIPSAEGRVKNLFGGSEYFYDKKFELWSLWIHEWGHPMGLAGHAPRSTISIMDDQNGSSVMLNVWDSFLTGWLDSSQVYCMPIAEKSLEISLTPLERLQSTTRGVIVPISSTNALVIESHRAEGWGKRMGAGYYGVSVYYVDTTMDTNRYAGSSGFIDTDSGEKWADNVVPPGATRTFDLLLQGDTVTYRGVTVAFTKTGDVDTVKITK